MAISSRALFRSSVGRIDRCAKRLLDANSRFQDSGRIDRRDARSKCRIAEENGRVSSYERELWLINVEEIGMKSKKDERAGALGGSPARP